MVIISSRRKLNQDPSDESGLTPAHGLAPATIGADTTGCFTFESIIACLKEPFTKVNWRANRAGDGPDYPRCSHQDQARKPFRETEQSPYFPVMRIIPVDLPIQ